MRSGILNMWCAADYGDRIDWSEIKDRIDLAMVATNLLGPAHQRKGNRLLWPCPFHDDQHPSFQVDLTRKTWRCWTCGIGGDAADLVMQVNGCDFPEAVRILADLSGVIPSSRERSPRTVADKPAVRLPEKPSGLPLEEASTLVAESTERLWGPRGKEILAYLHDRGLTDETIRAQSLGWVQEVMIPGWKYAVSGVTIPWRDGERLTRINVRRPEGSNPKYCWAYSYRASIYPSPAVIRVGEPLIIAEGEFDAVLLGQQLPEASVITLGSTSARTDPAVLARMLSSPRWFLALDADEAGDKAAAKFPGRATCVRPPEPDKDWTDVHRGGANRIRYIWGRYLAMSKKWEELEPKGNPSGNEIGPAL